MKYAVCVGTNYVGTPYELAGCYNDAVDWMNLLDDNGYEWMTLTDAHATRANILDALTDTVSKARWGGRIVVTFSGHGTWVPDYSGDELDRRDEAWCPDDFQASGLVTDDDLAGIFNRARTGVGILVLSDSCYSGTMTRFAGDYTNKRIRFLPPYLVARDGNLVGDAEAEAAIPLTRTYTNRASLISGSSEDDVSYDAWFGRRANGAFTRAAIDTYRSGMSLAAWHNAIRDRLPSADFPQAPQLVAANSYRKYARAL